MSTTFKRLKQMTIKFPSPEKMLGGIFEGHLKYTVGNSRTNYKYLLRSPQFPLFRSGCTCTRAVSFYFITGLN